MECHPGVPARWVILLPQNPRLPHQCISELMYLQPGNRGWGSQKKLGGSRGYRIGCFLVGPG